AGKGGGFKFIWVDIHPLIVYIPFIYKNPAINKVDSQGLSTFSAPILKELFLHLLRGMKDFKVLSRSYISHQVALY
ncbi:hypothetical protein ACFQ5B_05480, partial [Laceyella putida]|uniref:hypothetical protein n=1 Tax=Laceyella putida TaxID=110101 RepID=UPI003632CC74